jgi:hypothetical protein
MERTCVSSDPAGPGHDAGGGRSPWRALYRRIGAVLVVAAIAPEARVDPQGFDRAIRLAEERLSGLDPDMEVTDEGL